MALKEFRPLTPTQRFKSLPAFDEITKWRPEKSLLQPKKRSGGRNNRGRLTSRHIGGGHKHKYRKVDFKRRKYGVAAEVIGIEYDPNRSARIALIDIAAPKQIVEAADAVPAIAIGLDHEPMLALSCRHGCDPPTGD